MLSALLFAYDSVPMAEIRIDSLTERKIELDLCSKHGRELREGGMRREEENDEYYNPLLDIVPMGPDTCSEKDTTVRKINPGDP